MPCSLLWPCLLVLIWSLACTAAQVQQSIDPSPDNPAYGLDVSRTHLVNPMLEHVKSEHAKLLETAQLARHENLPADQLEERKQMLQALHAHHKHHRPHQGNDTGLDHHRASHAASHASALLRAQSEKWPDGYLAICIVVRDQVQDMRYWLEYHKWLGVGKVYIFDHNSTRPVMPAVFDHIRSGFVEYQYFRGRPRHVPRFSDTNQYLAYQRCLVQHYKRHRWLAFLDADEFLVLQPQADAEGVKDIGVMLAQYEKQGLGGLGVNWILFGSSGMEKRDSAGPLATFTSCIPPEHWESTHVKVIANTQYVLNMGGNPHEVVLRSGAHMVNEHMLEFKGPKTPTASWDKVALYHYVLKSKEEFAGKMDRGSGAGNVKTWEYWDYVEKLATNKWEWGMTVSKRFMASDPKLDYEHPSFSCNV